MSFLNKLFGGDTTNGIVKRNNDTSISNGSNIDDGIVLSDKQEKDSITDIIILFDVSSSMLGFTPALTKGLNGLVGGCKSMGGLCNLTLVYFSNEIKTIYNRVDLNDFDDYIQIVGGGSTSIHDAIAITIDRCIKKQLEDGEDKFPSKTIFIIISDGEDNTSSQFTYAQAGEKIKWAESTFGWNVFFLGTRFRVTKTAVGLNIPVDNVCSYVQDAKGLDAMFMSILRAVFNIRNSDNFPSDGDSSIYALPAKDDWKQDIINDSKERGIMLAQ